MSVDISTSLGSWNVAVAVANYLVARPLLTVPYRRLAVGVITLSAVHVLLAGSELPRDILAAIACGFLAASSVLLALGRPMRPLDPDQVAAALRRTAVDVSEVHPASVDARGSRPFFGTTTGGGGLFVKVLGREERSSDLLFRFYRWLRFRGLPLDPSFPNSTSMIGNISPFSHPPASSIVFLKSAGAAIETAALGHWTRVPGVP